MPAKESVIDNVIRSRAGNAGPCVVAGPGNHFLVGNTFTVAEPVAPKGGAGRTATSTADRRPQDDPGARHAKAPRDAGKPSPQSVRGPARHRRRRRRTAAQIDAAAAAEPAGGSPVVHLPKGKFTLGWTVVFPAGKAIQVAGDGGSEDGTVIGWNGAAAARACGCKGPAARRSATCGSPSSTAGRMQWSSNTPISPAAESTATRSSRGQ